MGLIQKAAEVLHIHKDRQAASSTSGAQATVFDPKKVTVIFVLGGPGVGESIQLSRLENLGPIQNSLHQARAPNARTSSGITDLSTSLVRKSGAHSRGQVLTPNERVSWRSPTG